MRRPAGREIDFLLTVQAAVTTLCPCSKAISRHGAHNQRGTVTVQLRFRQAIWIEDVIAMIESLGQQRVVFVVEAAG
jgi:GTP cyclohydrolase IB